jgi:hypothetical protein
MARGFSFVFSMQLSEENVTAFFRENAAGLRYRLQASSDYARIVGFKETCDAG